MLDQARVGSLLSKLCIELGFCLPSAQQQRLINAPPQDIEAFTNAVFVAEGLNPELADRNLYRQVQRVVAEAFDVASALDAQQCVQAATRETRSP
jgi:hypothetical protein